MPRDRVWDEFFDQPGIDFPGREQLAMQERDPLERDAGDKRSAD